MIITAFMIISAAIMIITISALCIEGDTADVINSAVSPSAINENSAAMRTESLANTAVSRDENDFSEVWKPNSTDVEYIAKTLYGECRGVSSETEKAAVVWCILNRVDTSGYACGTSIEYVVTFPGQFQGYSPDHPILPSLASIATDVLIRWHNEKSGQTDVGRVLPAEYLYFVGDGKHNYFSVEFLGKDYWDYSMASPYES